MLNDNPGLVNWTLNGFLVPFVGYWGLRYSLQSVVTQSCALSGASRMAAWFVFGCIQRSRSWPPLVTMCNRRAGPARPGIICNRNKAGTAPNTIGNIFETISKNRLRLRRDSFLLDIFRSYFQSFGDVHLCSFYFYFLPRPGLSNGLRTLSFWRVD